MLTIFNDLYWCSYRLHVYQKSKNLLLQLFNMFLMLQIYSEMKYYSSFSSLQTEYITLVNQIRALLEAPAQGNSDDSDEVPMYTYEDKTEDMIAMLHVKAHELRWYVFENKLYQVGDWKATLLRRTEPTLECIKCLQSENLKGVYLFDALKIQKQLTTLFEEYHDYEKIQSSLDNQSKIYKQIRDFQP